VFTSITKVFDLKRVSVVQIFKNVKSIRTSRATSFKSAQTKGASTWWQKWELENKLLFPPPILFFVVNKMTMMSLLSSFSSFCYYKKYDNGVIVVFFFVKKKLCFFPNITPFYLG
jgi:hypothetical protein